MRLTRWLVFAALLSLAVPAHAWSDDDKPEENTEIKDHPLIPRFPKSILIDGETKEFEELDFPTKADQNCDTETKKVEGRYTRRTYDNWVKSSATEIVRNYSNALQKAGFKIIVDCKGNATDRILSAENLTKGQTWVFLKTYGYNDWTQTELTIVEGKAMEQKIELDASAMMDEINKSGHVAVYGINFATGKAEISPDSAKVLGEIGKLLSDNKGLKIRVEGHTDNVGKAKDNLELSKKRAASVREWLMKNAKIDGGRLTTDGFGDSKPVGDNTTDEGRAKNRRVELVKL